MSRHTGKIKSFSGNKNYGFIISSSFDGDIFFGKKDLPPEFQSFTPADFDKFQLKDKDVSFQIAYQEKDGKQFAAQIRFSPIAIGTQSMRRGAVYGTVKSYIPAKGWGFLVSDQMPDKDVFFAKRDIQPLALRDEELKGMFATFVLSTEADGKLQAKEVTFQGDSFMALPMQPKMPKNSMMPYNSPGNGRPVMSSMGLGGANMTNPLDGQGMQGFVKFYESAKGWGFIKAQKVPQDIYFKDTNGINPYDGMVVCFVLRVMQDGKPQGHDVNPGLEDGQSCIGTVRWFEEKKGYGFVAVPGNPADIYLKGDQVPEERRDSSLEGLTVKFVARVNEDGKPHMNDCIFLDDPPAGYTPPDINRDRNLKRPVEQMPPADFKTMPATKRPRMLMPPPPNRNPPAYRSSAQPFKPAHLSW